MNFLNPTTNWKRILLLSFGENFSSNEDQEAADLHDKETPTPSYDDTFQRLEANRMAEVNDLDENPDPDQILEDGFRLLKIDRDGDGTIDEIRKVPDLSHPRWNNEAER